MKRGFVSLGVLLAFTAIGGARTAAAAHSVAASGKSRSIAAENARPGTTSWFIDSPRQDEISGYFDDVSYLPGGSATLYVDSAGDPFTYTVYRMGYYDGLGGRMVTSASVDENAAQPTARVSDDYSGGSKLLTTGWHSSAVIPVGTGWVSGYYLVKLHDDTNGGESYASFTVRSATPAPIVINLSTNTWQAYNRWGDLSLYRDSRVTPELASMQDVAHKVSFLRPYLDGWGAGQFFMYDRPLVEWAEAHGYPVSYSTDEDLRQARSAGPKTKLVIFSGHPEYYSTADREQLQQLTGRGVSEAFFGGNAWAWQARFNDASHVMTVWRKKSLDPEKKLRLKAVRWESVGLPQNGLTGTMPTWGTQAGAQTAYATASWPWKGAGVVGGTDLGTVEGTEWDGIAVNRDLQPNLLMLSRTPFSGMPGVPANQAMTLWQKTPSAFVFAGGQTGFNWNLLYPGVTPAQWVGQSRYPSTSDVKLPVERLVGNLIRRATGIANPIPSVAPSGTAASFAIVAPQPSQYVKAAPSPLSVAWSDPPPGTAKIRVYVDGGFVGNKTGVGNVLVAKGIAGLGTHTIRVVAVTHNGTVLTKLKEQVTVLGANSTVFRQNAQRVSRLWGDDDSDAEPVSACFLMAPA
ncbi:MAG TPA: N,N-dimethylformamidase beta subunit family domain-containing protein [Gaiellaceae bacterium]|jgi:hypothetical protein